MDMNVRSLGSGILIYKVENIGFLGALSKCSVGALSK